MIQNALITIILYSSIVMVVVASYRYVKGITRNDVLNGSILSIVQAIFFSFLFTLFGYFCINVSTQVHNWYGDKGNYLYSYLNYRSTSIGLDTLFDICRLYNVDFICIIYFATFFCALTALVAYFRSASSSPTSLLFFLCTDYIFLSLGQLKQCFACSFACLFFSELFGPASEKRDVLCLMFATAASLFHVTGYFLFFVYVVVKFVNGNSRYYKYVFLFLVLFLFLFKPVSIYFATLISGVLPSITSKIAQYFIEEDAVAEGGAAVTVVKGLPFFFISLWGILRRNELNRFLPNYDSYLLLSIMGSLFYMASLYSYWMFRFTALFYFPIGILFGMLYKTERNPLERFAAILCVLLAAIFVRFRHIILIYINYGGY